MGKREKTASTHPILYLPGSSALTLDVDEKQRQTGTLRSRVNGKRAGRVKRDGMMAAGRGEAVRAARLAGRASRDRIEDAQRFIVASCAGAGS